MVSKNFRNASGFLFQNLKNQVRAFHSQEVEKDKPDNPSEESQPPEREHVRGHITTPPYFFSKKKPEHTPSVKSARESLCKLCNGVLTYDCYRT